MSRLQEINEKRRLQREAEKQEELNKLNKIEYKESDVKMNWVAYVAITKIIENKIYNFCVTTYITGTKKYTMSIKNELLELAYYNKEYNDKNDIAKKWINEFNTLENYLNERLLIAE